MVDSEEVDQIAVAGQLRHLVQIVAYSNCIIFLQLALDINLLIRPVFSTDIFFQNLQFTTRFRQEHIGL